MTPSVLDAVVLSAKAPGICTRCKQYRTDGPDDFKSVLGHCVFCAIEHGFEENIPKGSCVLDVGSGMARYHPFLYKHTGGDMCLLDAHLPYMQEHKPPEGLPLIVGKAQEMLPALREGVFDACVCVDVIEHLVPSEAVAIIDEMKRIAPRVLILTPEGEHPQNHDPYGLGADSLQTHRSTWEAVDLEVLGFKVDRWERFHARAGHGKSPHALWGVWKRG